MSTCAIEGNMDWCYRMGAVGFVVATLTV